MHPLHITNKSALRSVLKQAMQESKQCRFLHRVHCVLLVGEGCSCYDLARWFGENPRTLARWVHHYEGFGVEGLRDEPRPGRPAKLGHAQLKALEVAVNKPPQALGYINSHWDGHLLAAHIASQYGVALSERHCRRILLSLQGPLSCSEKFQPSRPK